MDFTAQNRSLVRAIQNGEEDKLADLLYTNRGLIKFAVNKVTDGMNIDFKQKADLEDLCRIEMKEAVAFYDFNRDAEFSTYACNRMMNVIKKQMKMQ